MLYDCDKLRNRKYKYLNIKIISGTLTLLLYVILENKEEMLKKIISHEKSILIVR